MQNAENTELIASWLRHFEASQNGKVVRSEPGDHLANAIARVGEAGDLSE